MTDQVGDSQLVVLKPQLPGVGLTLEAGGRMPVWAVAAPMQEAAHLHVLLCIILFLFLLLGDHTESVLTTGSGMQRQVSACRSSFPAPHLFMNNSTSCSVLASRKMCCRCGKICGVTPAGKHSSVEECHYHFGRLVSPKGRYLVVPFHLLEEPVPKRWGEKWNKVFSSMCIC